MGKPKKTGTYPHFCLVIFAQGTWSEKERASFRLSFIKMREKLSDNDYPFFTKLVYREEKPFYSDCSLCGMIHDLLQETVGSNDHLFYQGHHLIILEDDRENMKELINIIKSNDKIKKIIILYLDPLKEIDRNTIKKWNLEELKRLLNHQKVTISSFEKTLEMNDFKSRTLYEISKF